jgi:hypothetical protein
VNFVEIFGYIWVSSKEQNDVDNLNSAVFSAHANWLFFSDVIKYFNVSMSS